MGSRLYSDCTSVADGQSSHLDHNEEDVSESLPDHLLLEVLVRVPMSDWRAAACTRKRWASLYKSEALWWTALSRTYPAAVTRPRWPGPIGRGSSKRRYTALHVSKTLLPFLDDDVDEVAGHVYLYLKDQLESSMYISYCLLHATVVDQFLACKKPRSVAQELASGIWLAVIDNLEETERTFRLLMRITDEWEVFQPYPYARSAVEWRLFERLLTDFRDFLSQCDYYEVLSRTKAKFAHIPGTWLGF